MKTLKITGYTVAGILFVLYALTILGAGWVKPVFASAPPGLNATIATTSSMSIGPGTPILLLMATSSGCSARIVSSASSAIMLSFTQAFGTTTLNGGVGHVQLASTTVAYDGGIYGCGQINAYAFATSTLTITDVR